MGGAAQWEPQRDAFDGLVAPDLPGFGANAQLPAIDSIPGFAAWVLDWLTEQGIERFDLLGHSMGGMIVQDMTDLAPDRVNRLILYATGAVGVLPGRFESIATSKRRAREDGFEPTARRIAATWFLDRENAPAYGFCADIAAQSAPGAMLAGLDAMHGWRGDDRLDRITCPTLVLAGDHDRTYSWALTEQLWQNIPGAQLAVIPGCAHAVHLEKPALFNARLAEFLSYPASTSSSVADRMPTI